MKGKANMKQKINKENINESGKQLKSLMKKKDRSDEKKYKKEGTTT